MEYEEFIIGKTFVKLDFYRTYEGVLRIPLWFKLSDAKNLSLNGIYRVIGKDPKLGNAYFIEGYPKSIHKNALVEVAELDYINQTISVFVDPEERGKIMSIIDI